MHGHRASSHAYHGHVGSYAELLSKISLFASLDAGATDTLADAATERSFDRGDFIFHQGDPADEVYVVVKGRIAMANRSIDGRESLLALMESEAVFGEMSLFDGEGRSTDARALEPSTVLILPYADVRKIYDTDPARLWHVVALLAGRLRNTDNALADSVFLDVTGRTAKRLLEMAGDDRSFTLPITQEELAGMVGASRERVNKAISSFVRLGWLEQDGGTYTILNRDQLTIRAN